MRPCFRGDVVKYPGYTEVVMQADRTRLSQALSEWIGHASAPSWRYDLLRCVPKLVALLSEGADEQERVSAVRRVIECQCGVQEGCTCDDPIALEWHVAMVAGALREMSEPGATNIAENSELPEVRCG